MGQKGLLNFGSFFSQVKLLLWKRYAELSKQPVEIAKLIIPPVGFFLLMILAYSVLHVIPGTLETILVPLAFWIFTQRVVVYVMYEKCFKLQEAMKMMGLHEPAYWISYFLFDGVFMGFLLSIMCTILTSYGLFNKGDAGEVFAILFFFCCAAVPFAFFLTCFYNTPQTSGQVSVAMLLGFYVVYFAINLNRKSHSIQLFCCLFPPFALQLGSNSFGSFYGGISAGQIVGMLIFDIFLYSILTWYFSQIFPSNYGVHQPVWFPFMSSYWYPVKKLINQQELSEVEAQRIGNVPIELVNEELMGQASIKLNRLTKTYGDQVVVNSLTFKLYENQIFALLGHNGAGKTTTINMLTGLISPDFYSTGSASVYGYDIHDSMHMVRTTMGVCPQHDVLFEALSVREHILLFSQLKGNSYATAEAEVEELTKFFHLHERLDHTGKELSGGQKRKLSVAIAICGGSKFIVLDEPTAGMDPLARRELWDLMSALRKGRTILLTTHYMDEADVLGDRVAIMSLGELQCLGSTHFLKTTFGAGYRLICHCSSNINNDMLNNLTQFVRKFIPEGKYVIDDNVEMQSVQYSLPFHSQKLFGIFFVELDKNLKDLGISSYGVQITSMEDVFLKVGEDHTVKPTTASSQVLGISGKRKHEYDFFVQVTGLFERKIRVATNDFSTVPLLAIPSLIFIVGAVLYYQEIIYNADIYNDIVMVFMYLGAYLSIPGLITEFIVREREDKLRNLLTIMGCDFKAYWIGTFCADYLLLLFPSVVLFVSWLSAGMNDFYDGQGGVAFAVMLFFNAQLIAFCYVCSWIFTSPKSAVAMMPMFVILLILAPMIVTLLVILILSVGLNVWNPEPDVVAGAIQWGTVLTTPHGSLLSALLNAIMHLSDYINTFPPMSACLVIMLSETAIYLLISYYSDAASVRKLDRLVDSNFDDSVLSTLDVDVMNERNFAISSEATSMPMRVERMRKVFPPKRSNRPPVIACQDVSFTVRPGEIFGLLGANGAGKTTLISMVTRGLAPTAGDALIVGNSVLSNFALSATHMGIVTQNNSLWDLLSVEDHLYLFARLRGVPNSEVDNIVAATIDQLELTPHCKKLAVTLSGGMKRKLCVAIALIGDPEVVLLDEPSAGLDPVSRRNLWNVILKTMSHRSVVLTTHSMEEAEALCGRIGIMVGGQLRALGTKQHLKSKFGSGYELCVKISTPKGSNSSSLIKSSYDFVTGIFPSAKVISENGGLVTYRIAREEMEMGKAFSSLEANKERLQIEDYSIAQPTLEQVFIRIVVDNTDEYSKSDRKSIKLSREILDNPEQGLLAEYEFAEPVNPLGCSRSTVTWFTVIWLFLFVLFIGMSFGFATAVMFALGLISMVCCCTGCVLMFCPCCQPPKGADEK